MFEGLNAVYEENEKRGFFKLNVVSLASILGALAFVIVSLLTITVVPELLSFLGLLGIGEAVNFARWPLLLVVACFMIGVIYLFQPEPRTAAMALDLAGKHLCCCYLDRGIVVGIFFSYPPTKTRSNTRRCR